MNNEDTIFADALAMTSSGERREFLDKSCGSDAELRARVEVLLAAHERAGSFLESPPTALATTDAGGAPDALLERPGAMVGSYKLLEQIGEGGMGVVFMAEQVHPVRRRVALKIIKPGMDTKQVIARFEAERQALAMMDHPNIARVLEAGATDAGRPFFVMELVRGIPITEYCDQHKLAPTQRLELFVQVCQAVQHAHQKGIIHRDLKPNNVLVTLADDGTPVPKVIDFGIAKATVGQRLTERTLFTEFRQLVGTPLYMSPEQAEMSALHDVDTRSDVYSLGVLLYELLTGTTPFDKQRLGKAAHDEMRRIIREEEPPRPSTRLSSLGETLAKVSISRGTEPRRLGQLVRGELDLIVMKCLEKERSRRYTTANALARDVERYLADEPVEASPPSAAYRLRKFARKHRAAVRVAAAFALLLVAATSLSTWLAVRATRARGAAEGANYQLGRALGVADERTREALRLKQVAEAIAAQRQISEAEALRIADRPGDAYNQYTGAREALMRLGEPTLAADLGLWETCQCAPVTTYAAADVTCGAVLADGRGAVTGGTDGLVRVWDLRTARQVRTLRRHAAKVNAVAVAPDGRTAVSAGEDGLLVVWDLSSGETRQTFAGHVGPVRGVALREGGRVALSGGDDGILREWDVATARELRRLRDPETDRILCAGLSADGTTAACGTHNGFVNVWDVASGQLAQHLRRAGGVYNAIRCVTVSSDGGTVLAGEVWGGYLTRWDRGTTGLRTLMQRGIAIGSIDIAPGPGGFVAFLAGTDRRISAWQFPQGELLSDGLGDQSETLSFTRDVPGQPFLFAGGEHLRLIQSESGIAERRLQGDNHWIFGVSLSPDGRFGASGGDARVGLAIAGPTPVRIWDTATGATVHICRGHGGPVWSTAFSPDGTRLLSAGEDGTLKVWDVASGRLLRTFASIHTGAVRCVAFLGEASGGGDPQAISGGADGALKRWRVATGEVLATVGTGAAPVHAMAVDRAGTAVAAGFDDGLVALWPSGGGPARWSVRHDGTGAGAVAFAPDGRRLVSGYTDGAIEVTDAASGTTVKRVAAHAGPVLSAAYRPQGDAFVTGGEEGTLRVWDAREVREIHAFERRPTNSVAVSGDGALVFCGGGARVLHLFDLSFPGRRRALEPLVAGARVALQRDPEDGPALATLGDWYALHGAHQWAAELLERARRNGAQVTAVTLARCYVSLGNWDAAEKEFRRAVTEGRLPPTYVDAFRAEERLAYLPALVERASSEVAAGEFRAAEADLARSLELDPDDHRKWMQLGALLAYFGDSDTGAVERWTAHCREMLERFGPSEDTDAAEQTMKVSLLLPLAPDGRAPPELLARLQPLRQRLEAQRMNSWGVRAIALYEYRAGNYALAANLIDQSLRMKSETTPVDVATCEMYRAMALSRLAGSGAPAREALRRGLAIVRRQIKVSGDGTANTSGYDDWLICLVALREAEDRLGVGPATRPQTGGGPPGPPSALPSPDESLRQSFERGIAEYDEILQLEGTSDADTTWALLGRADLYKRAGRFEAALDDTARAWSLNRDDRDTLEALACLHLYLGRVQEYRTDREELLHRHPQGVGDHPAKVCLLRPMGGAQASAVTAIVDRALSGGANAYTLQYFHGAKGMAEFRAGNNEAAVRWLALSREALTRTIETQPAMRRRVMIWDEVRTMDDYFLAMALRRLGRTDEARQALARAREQLRTQVPLPSSGSIKVAMPDWLMVQVVAREAEEEAGGAAGHLPEAVPSTAPADPAVPEARPDERSPANR